MDICYRWCCQFILSSIAAPIKGTRVKCICSAFPLPFSRVNCLIASRKEGIDKLVMKILNLTPKKEFDTSWFDIIKKELTKTTRIAVIGKYTGMKDAYKSIAESLYLAGLHQGVKVEDVYFEAEDTDLINKIKGFDELNVYAVHSLYLFQE